MISLRIFVSYVGADAVFAQQLIADLRAAGAGVVTDSDTVRDEAFVQFLNQELSRCQWLILVQTPASLQSLRIQTAVNMALNLVGRQKMMGVLRMIAASPDVADTQEVPLTWTATPEFDASQDYPRARDRMLLKLGLINIDDEFEGHTHERLTPVASSINARSSPWRDQPQNLGSSTISVDRSSQGQSDRPPPLPSAHRSFFSLFPSIKGNSASGAFNGQGGSLTDRPAPLKGQPPRLWPGLFYLGMGLALSIAIVLAVVHNFATAKPPVIPVTPTALATLTPEEIYTRATSGQPFLNDPLVSQDGNNWTEGQRNVGSCAFINGTYHASISSPNHYMSCLAGADQDRNLQNFAFQVQLKIDQGDAGGLIFRADQFGSTYYAFTICVDSSCQKGTYGLFVFPQPGKFARCVGICPGPAPAINADLNQTNILTVVALRSDIYLYINKQFVAHVQDNTLSLGEIGVTAFDAVNVTDATFSNAQVWKL